MKDKMHSNPIDVTTAYLLFFETDGSKDAGTYQEVIGSGIQLADKPIISSGKNVHIWLVRLFPTYKLAREAHLAALGLHSLQERMDVVKEISHGQ